MKNPFWIALIGLIVFMLFLNFIHLQDLKTLPAPMYGGDYYYQLGAVNHVKYGGNALSSTNTNNELPVYLPLYSFFVGNFAKIFNIDAIGSVFIFSYLITILSVLIIYLFSYKLFRSWLLSIIASLYFMTFIRLPLCKYTDFGCCLIVPLFIYLSYNFIKNKSLKNSIFLGIIFGLTGLTHPSAFMASSLFLLLLFIYYEIMENISFKEKTANKGLIKKNISKFIIVLIIGIPIALLWWFHPIFTFHGKPSFGYPVQIFTLSKQMEFFWNFLKNLFFNFSSLKNILISIFSLFGLFGLIFTKTKKSQIKFIKFLAVATFIIIFHYFITQNFFGFNLVPGYLTVLFARVSFVLFFIFGIIIFTNLVSPYLKKIKINKKAIYIIIIILLLVSFIPAYEKAQSKKFRENGKNPLPEHYVSLNNYLAKNGNVNDVILTTKELGFAVNGITGGKLISFRRGHAGPYQFIDLDTRELDSATMLYSNDTEYKKELFKNYDVKYLYWDYYWIQSEYNFDKKGKITNWFDPLLMHHSKEREDFLKNNNIKYFIETTWLDPSLRESFPKNKLIFISPENYHNVTHPWNPNMDDFLEEVWSYKSNGQTIAKLYEVKI